MELKVATCSSLLLLVCFGSRTTISVTEEKASGFDDPDGYRVQSVLWKPIRYNFTIVEILNWIYHKHKRVGVIEHYDVFFYNFEIL